MSEEDTGISATISGTVLFRWALTVMFAIIMGLCGYIASSLNGQIDATTHRLDRMENTVSGYGGVQDRLTRLETQLMDLKGRTP